MARVQRQERPTGVMAGITNAMHLVEQVLFVFVASLWPNVLPGAIEQERNEGEQEGANNGAGNLEPEGVF
jgi:hypothetical protein